MTRATAVRRPVGPTPAAWAGWTLSAWLVAAGVAAAQTPGPSAPGPERAAPTVDLNRIDPLTFRAVATRLPRGSAPRIDGRLSDPEWDLAPPAGDFVQREPDPGRPATERTEFRILYDDRKIYFGVWAYDSNPAGIIASEMKRDSGLNKGDRVAIVIDTFFDRRNGFYFATNPLGAEKDAQYTDNSRMRNNDWNAVWECRTSIDERGWFAEIAIPLSQLRFKRSIGESTWGLNVARSIVRKNEETYWVPYPRQQGVNGFAYLSNAGVLAGLHHLDAPRRFEFVPFVAPTAGHDFDAGASTNDLDRFGFDARLGLTDTLTADVTARTDFAQVEADQEVVNITRFSLFFPEKRPFFTESAGLFNYGKPGVESGDFGPGLLPLFYSRRIGLHDGREVPILAGARVTGRPGPYSVGLMTIVTDDLSPLSGLSGPQTPRANYSVARIKRNVLAQSTVGAIVLNRQGGPGADYNRTLGFDVNLVLQKDLRVTGLFAKTFTPGVAGNDYAGAIDIACQRDRYYYDLTYLDVGSRFNAEMGYIRRTDARNPRVKAGWTPRPNWPGVRQITVGGIAEVYATHAGAVESKTATGLFGVTFHDTSTLSVDVVRDYDLLTTPFALGHGAVPVGGHVWNTARLAYVSSPRRRVAGNATIETGRYYTGDKTTFTGGLSLLPLDTLLVELACSRNRVGLPDTATYVANTVSARVSYSFSPTLFVKAFAQYNDTRQLASLNLLLWSIFRPGSDIYVVYNQGWNTDVPGPASVQAKNRSVSVKMTYWLSR